jgi:hypothetical protein
VACCPHFGGGFSPYLGCRLVLFRFNFVCMITYYLGGAYYARLQIGQGLERVVFYGHSSTRALAIAIALSRAYEVGLIK